MQILIILEMKFIVVLIIWITHLMLACKERCPSDRPYCSDAGCISECPEPFYINGSDCVGDCGKLFVTVDRTCVESCPNNTFSKETLKQVYATQYLERKCIACSNYNEYIMNQTCVNMCPDKSRTLDERHCTTTCPADRPFKLERTISNLLHFVCVDKCPHFEEDGFCVDTCTENKVISGSSCLLNCPSSHPILMSKECISECPSTAISTGFPNNICIYQCPAENPYVSNNRCVSECPDTAKWKLYKDGITLCAGECIKGFYSHNDSCLSSCPISTVAANNSCVDSCPGKRMFKCMVKKGHTCGTGPKEQLDHNICVDACPENMFIVNRSCVYSCPIKMAAFNKECSNICPVDNPYLHNNTVTEGCSRYSGCSNVRHLLICTDKCPDETFMYKNVCMPYCPKNTFYDGQSCVEQCPFLKSNIQNASLTFSIWKKGRSSYKPFYKEEQSKDIQKCVSSCSHGMFRLNFSCVSACTNDYRFIRNMTCTNYKCITRYTYKNESGVFCIDTCESLDFEHNGTCVKNCPESYFVFNKKCEEKCPPSHPYSFKSEYGKKCDVYSKKCTAVKEVITCVSKCPNSSYINNKTCSSFCPKPLFTAGKECVQSCPESPRFIDKSFLTVTIWKRKTRSQLLESDEVNIPVSFCVSVCPPNKALVELTCTTACPVHSRFVYNGSCTNGPCNTTFSFHSSVGIVCTNICLSDRFEYNKTCLLHCPKKHFSLRQRCVTECTNEFNIVNNKTIVITPCSPASSDCAKALDYDIQCRHGCPGDKVQWNNTCRDICPDGTMFFNKTCVLRCPVTHKYIRIKRVTLVVWKLHMYSDRYFKTQNYIDIKECVKNCSLFTTANKCVERCPSSGTDCISSCADGTLADLRGKTCVQHCPDDMTEYDHTCRIVCGRDQLNKDGRCIGSYECSDKMFGFAGQCVKSCPDGYIWFVSCVSTFAIGLSIAVLLIATSGLITCGRNIYVEFCTITWFMFKTEAMVYRYLTDIRVQRQQANKDVGERPVKEEEILLLKDMDSEDDTSLFTATRYSIDDREMETVL